MNSNTYTDESALIDALEDNIRDIPAEILERLW